MNETIILEFQRLIAFLNEETDKYRLEKNTKKVTQNSFRIRQLATVLAILKKYPTKITIESLTELNDISGIGKGSLERIEEILKNGKLVELGNFVNIKQEKNKSINELEEIVGIGRAHALELYEQGITSIKILKDKIKKKEIEVNDKILLGLKYHGVYKTNIPREEVTSYNKLIGSIVKKINKKLDLSEDKEYVYEICGSYRREKLVSNDIDVLISKRGTKNNKTNCEKHLDRFIKKLKSDLKKNNGVPLLIDDMTDKKVTTKYMGFAKYLDNHVRRIDIRFVPYESFYSALLYFTGSGEFNKKMRNIAKEKGYKLSEYGLFDREGNRFKSKSERAIFKILDMEYLPPRLR